MFCECAEGGIHFLPKQKKENIAKSKCPFRAIPPAELDALFTQFFPAPLKSFRHPGGGGSTHF